MQGYLHGLRSHPDVSRFETEDALVRHAAASLLSTETTITSIIVDVEAHERPQSGSSPVGDHPVLEFRAFMTVIGEGDDASTPQLGDLVVDAAVVAGSWRVETTNIAELGKMWHGTATPGPKITAYFNPASSVSSPQYRTEVEELARTACSLMTDAGCRVTHVEDSSAPFATAISFWFPTASAAEDAAGAVLFDHISDSGIVDSASLVFMESISHRVVPNPNAWETTSGISPPTG